MNLTLGASQSQSDSATTLAYNTLRWMILTGDLAPGEKLKISGLREKLDIGASPIREALSLLVSDQLVVRQDQRGFSAAETSRENFDEILELRCSLEGKALRKSMECATGEWEEKIVLVHHRMTKLSSAKSDRFEREHKNFHMALLSNCKSPLLLRFCSQLYDLNIRYRFLASRSTSYKGRAIEDEHRQILTAVVEGNSDAAVRLLMSHYEMTGGFLKAYIE